MILRIRNHDNRRLHDHRLREDEVEEKAPLGTRKITPSSWACWSNAGCEAEGQAEMHGVSLLDRSAMVCLCNGWDQDEERNEESSVVHGPRCNVLPL